MIEDYIPHYNNCRVQWNPGVLTLMEKHYSYSLAAYTKPQKMAERMFWHFQKFPRHRSAMQLKKGFHHPNQAPEAENILLFFHCPLDGELFTEPGI